MKTIAMFPSFDEFRSSLFLSTSSDHNSGEFYPQLPLLRRVLFQCPSPPTKGCLLKVDVNCQACKMKMLEVLGSISGVYSVTIDAQAGTAKVSGEVDPNLLLRALARSGRHAELIWVKLNHPVLSSSNYDNGYSSYVSYEPYYYGSNGSYGSHGYGAIDEPYRYRRALHEHSYYDTNQQYYPKRRAVWEYPTSSTTIRYGHSSPQRARYVPGYPPQVYDSYEDEPINFCSVL